MPVHPRAEIARARKRASARTRASGRAIAAGWALVAAAIAGTTATSPAAASPIPVNIHGRGWIDAEIVRCTDGRLWMALPGRTGEFAVPVADVRWAVFPAPGVPPTAATDDNPSAATRLLAAYAERAELLPVPGSHAPVLGCEAAAMLRARGDPRAREILEAVAASAWDIGCRHRASLDLAEIRLDDDRPADALALADAVLAADTGDLRARPRAWLLRGLALERQGELSDALDAVLHPVALYARDPGILTVALEAAARICDTLGETDLAAEYRAELSGDPVPDDIPPPDTEADDPVDEPPPTSPGSVPDSPSQEGTTEP